MKKIIFATLITLSYLSLHSQVFFANYPLDGNGNDLSPNSFNGTLNGGVTTTSDRNSTPNSALRFDGINDYISVGNFPGITGHFNNNTVSVWLKTSNAGLSSQSFVMGSINDPGDGLCFAIILNGTFQNGWSPNSIYFYLRDINGTNFSYTINAPDFFDDKWHCLTFVTNNLSNHDFEAYIDAVPVSYTFNETEYPSNWVSFQHPFALGAVNNRGTYQGFYKGDMDEFRIYDYALDSNTVANNCNNTTIGVENDWITVVNQVSIYPNPTLNNLNIVVNNPGLIEMEIINSLGQTKYCGAIQTLIDINDYSSGIYHVNFKDINNNTYTRKFIKQ